MFCCTLLYVLSSIASIAIILMGKRELVALLNLMVERLFLAVPRGCLRVVIVVFPDHIRLLFLKLILNILKSRVKNLNNLFSFHPFRKKKRNMGSLH